MATTSLLAASSFFFLFLVSARNCLGLTCYNCNTDASGQVCLTNPEQVTAGASPCLEPNDDYCYTFRLEESPGVATTVSRGCCRIQEHSTICPPGSDFQELEEETYTTLLTRCREDLCNDGLGDEGRDAADNSEGNLIVEGVPKDYDFFEYPHGEQIVVITE